MGRHRGHNEGSIYWRDDRKRWVASVSLPNGKRASASFERKPDAQAWLREKQTQIERGAVPTSPKQTVQQYLSRWLTDVSKPGVRPRTHEYHAYIINTHLIPGLGRHRLERLSAQHIQALYADTLERGYSTATVRHIHRVLHRALTDAVRWGLLTNNPTELADQPRLISPEMQVLNEEEVARLLRAARGDKLEALYVLAVTTGMRQGELLALRWQEIDMETRSLSVTRTLIRMRGGAAQWGEPKSTRSRRRIALTDIAVDALRRHHEQQGIQRAAAGDQWHDHDLVFAASNGNPLNPSNIHTRSFRPLLQRAGLKQIRFHDLRHTAATLLLAQNEHPKLVQELLGHSSIAVTIDTYSHMVPGLQAAAVDRLGQRLSLVSSLLHGDGDDE